MKAYDFPIKVMLNSIIMSLNVHQIMKFPLNTCTDKHILFFHVWFFSSKLRDAFQIQP